MTPLETAARALLASVSPIEATSPTAVIPVRAAALAELARVVEEIGKARRAPSPSRICSCGHSALWHDGDCVGVCGAVGCHCKRCVLPIEVDAP